MITVHGEDESSELDAGRALAELIAAEWPAARDDDRARISIVVSAKCPGQKAQDVDLLLLMHLKPSQMVRIPRAAEIDRPRDVHIQSLCVAIEVKDHSPSGVEFGQDGTVRVRYPAHWHNCTVQNEKQVFSVKGFLQRLPNAPPPPFVARVIWLRGVPHEEMPEGLHSIVGMNATWPQMAAAILSTQQTRHRDGFHTLSATNDASDMIRVQTIFTRRFQPTLLDRKKLEAIAKPGPELLALPSGERQIICRGRGGTGKTIALLQLAYHRYTQNRQRSLLLTYNVALAAELERLLLLRGVRDRAAEASIRVETLHAFFRQVLLTTGLLREDEDFVRLFDDRLAALREYLADPDLLAAVRSESDLLVWDLVGIDEAQDCPPRERELLHRLFGPERCVVADGIDQMVRPNAPCDWQPSSDLRQSTRTVSFRKSLRQQYNLCRFANAVAADLGLSEWQLEANPELPGGRVILLTGPPTLPDALWQTIAEDNRRLGNQPVDMLFVVGSSGVENDDTCGPLAEFRNRGLEIWDGTRLEMRRIPAFRHELHRFVKYESCRGLEGWVTVLFGLDTFYQDCLNRFHRSAPPGLSDSTAQAWASEWIMIPLTRCISTLVIHLDNPESPFSRVLLSVVGKNKDFSERN